MSKEISGVTNKEPLMHISKRDGIETWKSWLIRMIATKMKKGQYVVNLNIYCHDELKQTILTITKLTVQEKFY